MSQKLFWFEIPFLWRLNVALPSGRSIFTIKSTIRSIFTTKSTLRSIFTIKVS